MDDALGTVDDHRLGRLSPVDPRSVWANEAHDFTPWLERNLDVLTDALGIEGIVSVRREVPVGGFSLDLLGEDSHGRLIAVENQLDGSDHSHLGQLLVYAAGLGASVVVWVAPRLREEHRAVLDWLNDHTDTDVDFFGVELGVVRIGDSPPAPVFNVVAQPNDWGKATRQIGQGNDLRSRRQAFYAAVFERIAEAMPTFRVPKPSTENWSAFRSGPFGNYGLVFAAQGVFRVEIYLDSTDPDLPKQIFDRLHARRTELEARLGSLDWERIDGRRACRISVQRPAPDLEDPDQTSETVTWAAERSLALMTLDGDLRSLVAELRTQ